MTSCLHACPSESLTELLCMGNGLLRALCMGNGLLRALRHMVS